MCCMHASDDTLNKAAGLTHLWVITTMSGASQGEGPSRGQYGVTSIAYWVQHSMIHVPCRLLHPGGQLCLVGLTYGDTPLSKLASGMSMMCLLLNAPTQLLRRSNGISHQVILFLGPHGTELCGVAGLTGTVHPSQYAGQQQDTLDQLLCNPVGLCMLSTRHSEQ